MFATGLIVFRETLEAALFVGIVAASTRGVAQRGRWLAAGVVAGCLGALALAAGMDKISGWADGVGQDLLNVGILSLALVMLTWHCVWVSTQGNQMVQDAKRLGYAVLDGNSKLWALSLAVALAVLREGAETVLFVAGFVSGSKDGQLSLLSGAGVGLAGGVLTGLLIYGGLARVKTQNLFAVTNVLILILAGSLASQLAKTLTQAGLLSHWSQPLWDGSAILSNDSSLGILLHALVGYEATPTGSQIAFYAATVAFIWFAAKQMKSWTERKKKSNHFRLNTSTMNRTI